MALCGLGFGLLAAVASVANLLIGAYQEADFLRHAEAPMSSLGSRDYTPVGRHAYGFYFDSALPTGEIILACIFVSAFFVALLTRRFASGIWTALIVFCASYLLYMIAGALAAQFIIGPELTFGGDSLPEVSILINLVTGALILLFATVVSSSASALGAFVRRLFSR
jgi:hypothetical protein